MNLSETMRKLWTDHVMWSRCCLIAVIEDLPDAPIARERLLKNQDDMGDAVGAIYGDQVGAQMATLLKEHIILATQLVAAAKAHNQEQFQEVHKKWYANADDVALFMNKVNPKWQLEEMRTMMYDHLALTNLDIQARLQKDWIGDVAVFDKVFDQALLMADKWARGIELQHSDKVL